MNAFPSKSLSDNRKSAIQNPKWVGIVAIALSFAFGGVEAQAQQPTKVPRIGYLGASDPTNNAARLEAFHQGSPRAWIREGEEHCH
jgi:hypothetical protein